MNLNKSILIAIALLFAPIQFTSANEMIFSEPYETFVGPVDNPIRFTTEFKKNGEIITGIYLWEENGGISEGQLFDLTLDGQDIFGQFQRGENGGRYFVKFNKDFTSFEGKFMFSDGTAAIWGQNSAFSAAAANSASKVVKDIAVYYDIYQMQADNCKGVVSLNELEELVSFIIKQVLLQSDTEENAYDSVKDEAWNYSVNSLKNDSQHQMNKSMFVQLSKAKRKKACKESVEKISGRLRGIKMQVESMMEQSTSKKPF